MICLRYAIGSGPTPNSHRLRKASLLLPARIFGLVEEVFSSKTAQLSEIAAAAWSILVSVFSGRLRFGSIA